MITNNTYSLSVVIPAYNEEDIILQTIDEILSYLQTHFDDFELIVVDDGSKDSTFKFISEAKGIVPISNGKNRGKGYSVKNGILNSNKEYVLFIDADHAMPISHLEEFANYIPEFDIVIGSKYLENNENLPLFRKVVGNVFSLTKRLLTGLSYKDTQCGFKLFKTTTAKQIFSHTLIDGWCFDVEVLYIAKKLNIKIKEKAIRLKKLDRVSRINVFGSGFKMLRDLLVIRKNAISGKYNFKKK